MGHGKIITTLELIDRRGEEYSGYVTGTKERAWEGNDERR